MKEIPLFLDLDGVLNGAYAWAAKEIFGFDKLFLHPLGSLKQNRGDSISVYKLNVLTNIVNKYNVKIIGVSSCFHSINKAEDYAEALGLPIIEIGETGGGTERGKYILKYIKENNIENFIVLDDSEQFYDFSEFEPYKKYCIFPAGRHGMTDFNFECLEVMIKNFIYGTNYSPYRTTTKFCYNCGCRNMIEFSSLNKKTCSACGTDVPWNLEEGQKYKA